MELIFAAGASAIAMMTAPAAAAGATGGATAAVAAAGVAGAASSVVLMPLGIGAACCAAVAAATAAILAAQGEVKELEPEIGVTDEVLGCGCQGTVVVGNFGNRMVAVKRSELKDQLATEARFLTLCQSPFVVKLLHCQPGILALECLRPLLFGKPQVNVRSLLAGLFSGLGHIHSLEVARRDNVLQAPCGALKLADFGCASKEANGRFFETAGSLKCWAPEMIELADQGYCGFAADLWAAGVVSLELICGKYPFRGRTGRGISIGNTKAKILAGPEASDPDF